ncbi:MAG: hypothetical protein ACK5P7_06135 [Bdellovibrio sp.]|jgi:hypothetical protein
MRIFILLFLGLAACSSMPLVPLPISSENQSFLSSFDKINAQAFKDLSRGQDLEQVSISSYMFVVGRYKSKLANQFQIAFEDFEYKDLTPYPGTFVVCAYSTRRNLVMCDNVACEGIENAATIVGTRDEPSVGAQSLAQISSWRGSFKPKPCSPSRSRSSTSPGT